MTPFPYRAEDVHLTLRPTHQTREPLRAPEAVDVIRNDRLMAIINETHQAKHKVGQVGYVAEPWAVFLY